MSHRGAGPFPVVSSSCAQLPQGGGPSSGCRGVLCPVRAGAKIPVLEAGFPRELETVGTAPSLPGLSCLVSPPGEAAQPCHVRGAEGGVRAESLPCGVQPVFSDHGTSLFSY